MTAVSCTTATSLSPEFLIKSTYTHQSYIAGATVDQEVIDDEEGLWYDS